MGRDQMRFFCAKALAVLALTRSLSSPGWAGPRPGRSRQVRSPKPCS